MDSSGLGALSRLRGNEASISLIITGPQLLKIFEVTGLTKVVAIHGSIDEAASC